MKNLIGITDLKNQTYVTAIQSLDMESKQMGSAWLQSIIDHVLSEALDILPSFK